MKVGIKRIAQALTLDRVFEKYKEKPFPVGLENVAGKPISQVIKDDEWLSLCKIVDPANDVEGYTYSHETRCNGHIVSIVPYRRIGKDAWEYLLRKEITPCWGMDESVSSITGGSEPGSEPEEDAQRELLEEAGYSVDLDQIISLGECRGTKSSDTVYHIFSCDLTNTEPEGAGTGDGSKLEEKASCFWTADTKLAVDPLVAVARCRLAL